jgi:hypothetical protein
MPAMRLEALGQQFLVVHRSPFRNAVGMGAEDDRSTAPALPRNLTG